MSNIPNFDKMNAFAQEKILILPSYVQQLALSRRRQTELTSRMEGMELALENSLSGERLLASFLAGEIYRLVWTVLIDYPNQQEFHPAIAVVRDENLHAIDLQIAEDLSAWLPKEPGRINVNDFWKQEIIVGRA